MTAAKPDIAPLDGAWTSALAAELARIPRRVRVAIGLPDVAIQFLETFLRMLRVLLDDDDPRDLAERATDLAPMLETLVGDAPGAAALEQFTRWTEDEVKAKLERHLHRLTSPNGRKFLRQAMGANRYDRLKQALIDDGNLLMLASRRMLHYVLPLVQALQDAAATLPPAEREQVAVLTSADQPLVQLAIQLDGVIDDFINRHGIRIDQLDVPARPDELTRLELDADQLVTALRMVLRAETDSRITELSDMLGRKLRGFEQALAHSDDGISQAANSLVEFINWLLRQAFDDTYVLDWCAQHYPGDRDLVYQDKATGVVKPTTQGRAMCFVHAGEAPMEPDTFGRVLAVSLSTARRKAEKLKHGGVDHAEAADTLRGLMDAVRGVMTLVLRFAWGLAHTERLDYLRDRLAS